MPGPEPGAGFSSEPSVPSSACQRAGAVQDSTPEMGRPSLKMKSSSEPSLKGPPTTNTPPGRVVEGRSKPRRASSEPAAGSRAPSASMDPPTLGPPTVVPPAVVPPATDPPAAGPRAGSRSHRSSRSSSCVSSRTAPSSPKRGSRKVRTRSGYCEASRSPARRIASQPPGTTTRSSADPSASIRSAAVTNLVTKGQVIGCTLGESKRPADSLTKAWAPNHLGSYPARAKNAAGSRLQV